MNTILVTAMIAALLASPTANAAPIPPASNTAESTTNLPKDLLKLMEASRSYSGPLYGNPHEAEYKAAFAEIDAAKKLLLSGHPDQAAAKYRAIMAAFPDGTSPYINCLEGMGDADAALGNLTEALTLYRKLVYFQPGQKWLTSRSNDADLRMKFAILLQRAGLYDEALFNFNKGLEGRVNWNSLDPRMPLTRKMISVNEQTVSTPRFPYAAHLVIAAMRMDYDDDEAAAHLRQAIQLRPDAAEAHFYLACSLRRNKTATEEIRRELQKAGELGDLNVRTAAARRLYCLSVPVVPAAPPLAVSMPSNGTAH